MKCAACQREIALAKRCPYCGAPAATEDRSRGEKKHHRHGSRPGTRGVFRGSLRDPPGTGGSVAPSLTNVLRFFLDPRIAIQRKLLVYLGIFYILSPIDLFPGALLPVVGWLDDLAVVMAMWRWIAWNLKRVDPGP